ncbi:replicative DNA helicase [Halobacillus sp. Marseille-Q1614]|uniref:replicative DNA helicase n=1 Tax=Halobacillus sp. Marseille-Q1614 TaxID=2709134 RepID=UPI00156D55CC|nr:replicative DNA helicase [Halobacillus sp. Marseille-Q1614]
MIYNQEAEQSVIGSLLLEGELAKDVTLRSEHFCDQRHRLIYQAVRKIEIAGEPVNLVTVTTELHEKIKAAGGVSYLSELAASIPTTATLKHHQRLVLDAYRNRKTKEEATRYVQNPNEDTLNLLMAKFEEYREEGMISEEVSNYETLLNISRQLCDPPKDHMTGFATGYNDIDQLTGGTQRSDLIIIAARPSMGKTAFALNLAGHHCKNGGRTHLFSLEMHREALLKRLLSCEGEIDAQKWRSLNFSNEDFENCLTIVGDIAEWNLHIHERMRTVADIRATIRQSIRKHSDKPLIIIDYLQLLAANGRFERRDLEVGAITRELKLLALELDIPIVLLSQLSRGVEQRKDKRPMMSDLRESGNIEQDADVIGFLYREDYYKRDGGENNEIELIISKQRNGPVGTVKLEFEKEYGRFVG